MDLQAYWIPSTGNRDFKKNPRMVVKAKFVVEPASGLPPAAVGR